MPIWKNSLMTTAYLDDSFADVDDPCEVRITDSEIVVSYINEDESGYDLYKGQEIADGHFKLFCEEKQGKATLHLVENENVLEGFWVEGGNQGFWRIELIK